MYDERVTNDDTSARRFRRTDLQAFAVALSEGMTHGGLNGYDLALDITTEGNKAERAAAILGRIYDEPDADDRLLRILDDLYVTHPRAGFNRRSPQYSVLEKRVLQPRGVVWGEDGFTLQREPSPPPGAGASAPPASTSSTSAASTSSTHNPISAVPSPSASAVARKPGAAEGASTPVRAESTSHSVFVVHGRDMRPVAVVKQFLGFLGLRMMPWSEAVALTGTPQPHTYDVVKAGIEHSAAVIVIFSPDDEARLRPDLAREGDPDLTPRGQARQNVLLEAGLAFGIAADKTIFVKSAVTREISDIAGFNWIKLDGEWDSRSDLKQRLVRAGAPVRLNGENLADDAAGPFEVVRPSLGL